MFAVLTWLWEYDEITKINLRIVSPSMIVVILFAFRSVRTLFNTLKTFSLPSSFDRNVLSASIIFCVHFKMEMSNFHNSEGSFLSEWEWCTYKVLRQLPHNGFILHGTCPGITYKTEIKVECISSVSGMFDAYGISDNFVAQDVSAMEYWNQFR